MLRSRGVSIVLGISAFAGASASIAAFAQTSDLAAAKEAAIASLNAGNAQAACDRLKPLLPAHQDDLVLHFLLGECLAHSGDLDEAIEQYRLVLAKDPNAVRARASLAAAEAARGDNIAAHSDYDAVLAQNIPDSIRQQLQAAAERVPSRQSWSGAASLGFMYDSNVDVGPWKNAVTMFGAPFQLITTPSRAEGDWATLATAGLNYSYSVTDEVALLAAFNANAVGYARLSHFDYDGYSFVAGPAYTSSAFRLSSNLGVNLARLGDALYSLSWTAAPDLAVPLSRTLSFDEQLSVQHNHYYTTDLTDGWSAATSTSVQWHYLESAAYLQPKIVLTHQNALNSIYTNDQIAGAIDLFQPIGAGFSVLLEPALTKAYYRGFDAAFGGTRRDTIYAMTANVGYELGFHHSQLALGVMVIGNRSNQSLYTYNRTQTTLQFKLPF
jgi:tetratricopeptide (TPR) repeat protein